MSEALSLLETLLEEERQAALAANIQVLVEIQERKRQALENCKSSQVSENALTSLSELAKRNIKLMQHLSKCLRSLITDHEGVGYSATGQTVTSSRLPLRGRI